MRSVPELLAPAGSLEKLKIAVLYGADAVYLGGQNFGLRSAAENFTHSELLEGVQFAHERKSHVYVVLNSFLHEKDFEKLPAFLEFLAEIEVDALIVSDIGVISFIQKYCEIPIHLSTQASCLNTYAAKFWKKSGVKRLILGREVSIDEARKIKEASGLEVELFIHGSMCMSYSGHCVISNYTQGRDSNRGGCAHSCRFEYKVDQKDDLTATFLSSKDLSGVGELGKFIEAGIDSIKVEGRMKSIHYAGTISKVYRELIDEYEEKNLNSKELLIWADLESQKVTHRTYHTGNLINRADEKSVYSERDHEESDYKIAGQVLAVDKNGKLIVQIRSSFNLEASLELVPFKGKAIPLTNNKFFDLEDEEVFKIKPGSCLRLATDHQGEKYNLIRYREEQS